MPHTKLFSCARGFFWRSRMRGTQRARRYTTARVWVSAGLRGACSRRSKSRYLASNNRIAFRGARAEQDNQLFCCTAISTVTTIASSFPRSYSCGHYHACVDHYYACAVMMYACMCCVCVLRIRVFASVRGCPCVC